MKDNVERVTGSLCAKDQLDPFSHFDGTPTSDKQTQTQGHRYYRVYKTQFTLLYKCRS